MIYTGLRPTELLEIQTENVHLDEKYMVGGMKTEAGKDRIIPLNDKIIPLVKNRYDANKKYHKCIQQSVLIYCFISCSLL